MSTQHAVLLSHAFEAEPTGCYADRRDAQNLAESILTAQPGIEAVIVSRTSPDEHWRTDTGETPIDYTRRVWPGT